MLTSAPNLLLVVWNAFFSLSIDYFRSDNLNFSICRARELRWGWWQQQRPSRGR